LNQCCNPQILERKWNALFRSTHAYARTLIALDGYHKHKKWITNPIKSIKKTLSKSKEFSLDDMVNDIVSKSWEEIEANIQAPVRETLRDIHDGDKQKKSTSISKSSTFLKFLMIMFAFSQLF